MSWQDTNLLSRHLSTLQPLTLLSTLPLWRLVNILSIAVLIVNIGEGSRVLLWQGLAVWGKLRNAVYWLCSVLTVMCSQETQRLRRMSFSSSWCTEVQVIAAETEVRGEGLLVYLNFDLSDYLKRDKSVLQQLLTLFVLLLNCQALLSENRSGLHAGHSNTLTSPLWSISFVSFSELKVKSDVILAAVNKHLSTLTFTDIVAHVKNDLHVLSEVIQMLSDKPLQLSSHLQCS